MPHSVNSMEHKRPRSNELDTRLRRQRQTGESRNERLALQVPAGQRSDQVRGAVQVQKTAETGTREALPDGTAEIGLLLVVDGEVGGDGALEALLVEEGAGVGGGDFLGCDGTASRVRAGEFRLGSWGREGKTMGGRGPAYRDCVAERFDASAALAKFWVKKAPDGLVATGRREYSQSYGNRPGEWFVRLFDVILAKPERKHTSPKRRCANPLSNHCE